MPDALIARSLELFELEAAAHERLVEFGGAAPRPAKAFDRSGNVMLCSSFSKTLAPGLKAGWIEPGRWRDSVRLLKFMSSGGANELIELAVAELIESGGYERSLRQLRRRFEQQSVLRADSVSCVSF